MGKRSPQLDLKTYDRATIDRVLAPARPAPDATVRRHSARSEGIAGLVWAAGLLALAVLAYHFTLITTLRMPSAVPACLVLAVALTAAHRRRRGPNIHDRYTDYIVGIPLLGAAMLLLALGPSQLSVFAWLWRLDLLSLPLFVAGAISILFGVRALWAQRLPLTVVAFPWLLSITGMAGNQTVLTATVVLAALAVAFAGIASVRFLRSERPPGPSRRSARSPVALVILLAIAMAAAVADQRLAEFQPLFDSSGRPTISAEAAMPAVTGWTSYHQVDYPWIQRYVDAGASWRRYGYIPADPRQPALVVDVLTVPRFGALSGQGLDVFYRLHGDRELEVRSVRLAHGVMAHVVRYADPSRPVPWDAVYWDWPVHATPGVQYQRIVVSASGLQQVSAATMTSFADGLIDSALMQAGR